MKLFIATLAYFGLLSLARSNPVTPLCKDVTDKIICSGITVIPTCENKTHEYTPCNCEPGKECKLKDPVFECTYECLSTSANYGQKFGDDSLYANSPPDDKDQQLENGAPPANAPVDPLPDPPAGGPVGVPGAPPP